MFLCVLTIVGQSGCAGTARTTINNTLTCVDKHEDACPKPTDIGDWKAWLQFAGCLGLSSLQCVDDANAVEAPAGQFAPCEEDDVQACIDAGTCTSVDTCKGLASLCLDEVCR